MTALDAISDIVFPDERYAQLVDHCRRKLRQEYLEDEVPERKAFGLLAGVLEGRQMVVTRVIPLRRNLRWDPQYKEDIDRLMHEAAAPSETPLEQRGWVADPREILSAYQVCESEGSILFGNYHMHRVPWPHDRLRDTCTELDRRLADGCGVWVFIVSMVNPERPIVRAFFEGCNDRAVRVRVGREALDG